MERWRSEFLRLQVQSLQHAMVREETEIITTTARAHAMPDIQIETEILDTADLCPKPNKNVGRKGERRQKEKKKSKREIKAAAADSCEQRVFPYRLLLIFHFLCLIPLMHLTPDGR